MANLPTTYTTGTVTVGAGSTTVTGSGSSFVAAGIEPGDIFWAAGLSVRIAAVNSATSLTLAYPWPGAALSAANYEVRYTPDITRALASARDVLTQLTNGNLSSVAALATAANKLAYYTGQGTAALTDLTPEARTLLGSTALSRAGTNYTLNGMLVGTAVTSDALDTTAGRLARVGFGGIGLTTNGIGAPGDDANLCMSTAFNYRFTTMGINCPISNPYGGSLHVFRGFGPDASTYRIQQVFLSQANVMYHRATVDSGVTWSSWRRLLHNEIILGTVAQSGGAPIGAIIERGSNANGEYVRFADGTQICTATLPAAATTSANGALYRSVARTWTFPAAFIAQPAISGGVRQASTWPVFEVLTTTGVNFRGMSTASDVAEHQTAMTAIGRWF